MRSTRVDAERDDDAGEWLSRCARYTPLFILIYFAVQLVVRLCLSSNLEVDDAEMVGQIDLAWGYPNSHPPVFHWIVGICYQLFGYWPAATAVAKYALLGCGYLLVYDAARRTSGLALTGALAAASLLFIPVIAWKTQGKLTHSILGFAATAALMHAVILAVTRGKIRHFVWLGVAAAVGILAKYNFLFVLGAVAIAIVAVPEARRLFRRWPVLLSAGIAVLLTAPHLLWLRANRDLATERLHMLKTGGGPMGMNLNANSVVDGLVSFVLVVGVSIVPAFAIWMLVTWWRTPPSSGNDQRTAVIQRIVGWTLVAELAIFAVVIVAAGFTQVHERYLLVLLPPVPLWLALRFASPPRARPAALILAAASGVAIFVTVARPISVMRGRSSLGYPYAQIAERMSPLFETSAAILADRPENVGNIAMRVRNATVYDSRRPAERVVIIGDSEARLLRLSERLTPSYAAAGEVMRFEAPLRWQRDQTAQLFAQLWLKDGR